MAGTDGSRPIVLIHGAWHGAWCWERVTPLLDAADVPWVAPDLPSSTSSEEAGLPEDVQVVERILDDLPGNEPAVLVGHSRGGLVISEAGAHERAGHLVYLCALLLQPGMDATAMLGAEVMASLDFGEDLVSSVRPGMAERLFYNDCSRRDAQWATDQLTPLFGGGGVDEPRHAYATNPSTYVVCELDAALPADRQREMAGAADHVVTWPTGHSPFVNRPELVADLLIGLSTGADEPERSRSRS
jgi:pimeloyl-ACP methyl ester carboxylesterase